jgi:hypothetical protein
VSRIISDEGLARNTPVSAEIDLVSRLATRLKPHPGQHRASGRMLFVLCTPTI